MSAARPVQLFLLLLFVLHLSNLRADTPAPRPALPPPLAVGGECRALVSCPFTGDLGAHVRFGGLLWLAQPGDPWPISIFGFAALSASLFRWAEAGVLFSGRVSSPPPGAPSLLQHPITLWARFSPQVGGDDGVAVAAEVQYAVGRPPFDAGGDLFPDIETYAILAGYRKSIVDLAISGAYQEAGGRSYRGFQVGGGLWFRLGRHSTIELGAEAVARIGGVDQDLAPSWMTAVGLRLLDEHGIHGGITYTFGGGAEMPPHGPLFGFGLSFGAGYKPHESARPEKQPDGLPQQGSPDSTKIARSWA